MPFDSVTPEQQSVVAEYVRQTRAVVGEFARLMNHMGALDNMYDGQVVGAWATLAAGDLITDGSGLAGVSSVDKASITQLATAMQNVLNTYNTEALRQLYVKVAGIANVIG